MATDLLARYLPVALFAIFALLFPVGTFLATRFIRRDNPTPLKDLTYECGEVPEGEAMIQFHFQYYVFAIIFVVFDVAAIFLLLWALSFDATRATQVGFAAIVLFVAIMFAATNYALKKEEVLYI
ncbi:MAG: NADH-quinone oxidoreductase subunit A [Euryarchaeota archaeon]|nr:NADH-quinone oxidoreductase subunit A [Euryarchaeota archaeon]